MAISYGTETVTISAVKVLDANSGDRTRQICNTDSSVTAYFGPDSSVTTANGMPLYPTQSLANEEILAGYKGDVYVITGSSADIRYFQYNV
jgi:hypothetical protein